MPEPCPFAAVGCLAQLLNVITSASCCGWQAEEVDARMLGALVAGVRRAFPYVDASEVEAVIDTHADALFRITHTAPLGVSLQARVAVMFSCSAGA